MGKLCLTKSPCLCRLLLLACLLCFAGCTPESQIAEKDEKHYVRGEQLLKENKPQEALAAFLKVIEKRRDAADSHLEAGRLYLTQAKDPVLATYHFTRYLELRPQSDEAPLVRQMIETSKKEFVRQLPGSPFAADVARADMAENLQRLQTENAALKRDLDQARQQLSYYQQTKAAASAATPPVRAASPAARSTAPSRAAAPVPEGTVQPMPAAATPPAGARVYVVAQGDTLSRISTRMYGSPNRWKDIYEANRDRLASPAALKLGQELRIPR